ncbi:hypothetical protein ACMA5I_11155 [Paracoccaceae bacterium GXU_MW_L88]
MTETDAPQPDTAAPRVRRRKVFYLPGYDPMAPRRYRELYRKQAGRQAAISGYDITVKATSSKRANYSWHAEMVHDGARSEADIEFLIWNDIVQASMERSIFATYILMWRTLWIYMRSRTLSALYKMRPAPMIAALYPVFALNLQLYFAWLIGEIIAWRLTGWIDTLVVCTTIACVLPIFRRYDRHIFAYYLLHDYAFSAQFNGRTPPELRPRITDFAARVSAALDQDYDEVLVVGHSSGAHLAVEVLAKLLTERDVPAEKELAFLTVGQVIPMISFLPDANELRRDLNFLARTENLTWVDVSAPSDGACFALCDPVAVSGAKPAPEEDYGPKIISAAYTETLSDETRRRIRFRFFRKHIQYLYAFDQPRDYDYFQITAGPLSLKSRFGWRESTASTVGDVYSRYTDF